MVAVKYFGGLIDRTAQTDVVACSVNDSVRLPSLIVIILNLRDDGHIPFTCQFLKEVCRYRVKCLTCTWAASAFVYSHALIFIEYADKQHWFQVLKRSEAEVQTFCAVDGIYIFRAELLTIIGQHLFFSQIVQHGDKLSWIVHQIHCWFYILFLRFYVEPYEVRILLRVFNACYCCCSGRTIRLVDGYMQGVVAYDGSLLVVETYDREDVSAANLNGEHERIGLNLVVTFIYAFCSVVLQYGWGHTLLSEEQHPVVVVVGGERSYYILHCRFSLAWQLDAALCAGSWNLNFVLHNLLASIHILTCIKTRECSYLWLKRHSEVVTQVVLPSWASTCCRCPYTPVLFIIPFFIFAPLILGKFIEKVTLSVTFCHKHYPSGTRIDSPRSIPLRIVVLIPVVTIVDSNGLRTPQYLTVVEVLHVACSPHMQTGVHIGTCESITVAHSVWNLKMECESVGRSLYNSNKALICSCCELMAWYIILAIKAVYQHQGVLSIALQSINGQCVLTIGNSEHTAIGSSVWIQNSSIKVWCVYITFFYKVGNLLDTIGSQCEHCRCSSDILF